MRTRLLMVLSGDNRKKQFVLDGVGLSSSGRDLRKSSLKLDFCPGAFSKTVGEDHLRVVNVRKNKRYKSFPASVWLLNKMPMGCCLIEVEKCR